MKFIFDGEFYKITRVTGVHHNFLGISFCDDCNTPLEIKAFSSESKQESVFESDVKKQVIQGIEEINKELETNYKVKKIQFVSSDTPSNSVYSYLAKEIVKRISVEKVS